MVTSASRLATIRVAEVFVSLEARIKAIEDSDTNLNQEVAKAIIDLQHRIAALEKTLALHTAKAELCAADLPS
jgi:hypothetical protein